ncbi:PDZ domain-containing protein [Luteolibacter ambystomatis]|uniref:PDZ domain-containing protein n=1 Tax=Luteolibacter ambystomatis TaxID=2824561 RepID=A0A975J311_9BACT|nr:PDZ domain-containing protein [Luteolibacter ambystomatis]QUE53120.1 PDZ domain-containing protein [Luteolibacter ambystomatis]
MKLVRFILPIALLLSGTRAAEPPERAQADEKAPAVSTAPFPGTGIETPRPAGSGEDTGAPTPDTARLGLGKPGDTVQGPAWLGFSLAKPDETTRSHLPDLPLGMGFTIQAVEAKGPAALAGLQPLDVIWKFGDQFLVNESQLAVLLRQKHPGDTVNLALFRSGRALELPVIIGSYPLNRPLPIGPVENVLMREDDGLVTRIINRESRTASLALDDGRASLKRIADGKGYELRIIDATGELVFNGNLPADCDVSAVPEAWRIRVKALRRGLDNALDGRMESVRPPRPRVIPPQPSVAEGQ